MAELAKEELDELSKESVKLENQLKILLLPKDPLDERNIMLEVITPEAIVFLFYLYETTACFEVLAWGLPSVIGLSSKCSPNASCLQRLSINHTAWKGHQEYVWD